MHFDDKSENGLLILSGLSSYFCLKVPKFFIYLFFAPFGSAERRPVGRGREQQIGGSAR
jgi:hypothetical protein